MVLHVKYKSFDVMLMGDLEKEGEKDLIRRKKLPQLLEGGNKIEVLKAGHHGSKGATSEELLDILKPQMAVFVLWKRKSLRASGTGNHRTVRKGELPGRFYGKVW